MGLNRHTSSDESGGNLGAELSYYMWTSISSGKTRISDFCLENFGFGQKSRAQVAVIIPREAGCLRAGRQAGRYVLHFS